MRRANSYFIRAERGRIGWVRPLPMGSHDLPGASQQSHLCMVDEMILN